MSVELLHVSIPAEALILHAARESFTSEQLRKMASAFLRIADEKDAE